MFDRRPQLITQHMEKGYNASTNETIVNDIAAFAGSVTFPAGIGLTPGSAIVPARRDICTPLRGEKLAA